MEKNFTKDGLILLNKSKGISSFAAINELKRKIKAKKVGHAGTLDPMAEGLMIVMVNDATKFSDDLMKKEKEYYVEVNGPLDNSCIQRFHDGIMFHDGTICKPAELSILESSPSFSKATVTISEGKFHQIKKMFLCVGVKVTFLKRIRFGEFNLDSSLPPGEYRPFNSSELQLLKQYFD